MTLSSPQHARESRRNAGARLPTGNEGAARERDGVLEQALALIARGHAGEVLAHARRLCRAQPALAVAYTIQAKALCALGQPEEALIALRALPAQAATDANYLATLAMTLQRLERHGESLSVFLQALSLKIDDALLHYHLGAAFKAQQMKAEAAECLRTAVVLGLGGSDLAARGQLVFLEREACRWEQAESELAELRAKVRALPCGEPAETSAFTHAVLVADPMEQLKVSTHYALHVARNIRPLPRIRARKRAGRLRVGYLSADFQNHATSQLLVQTLEAHDRHQFEISCLSTGADDGSALRRRVVAAAEHFVDLHGVGHERTARRVREQGIDILIDLKGATANTLLPVLAFRPAPLQVAWLGFPGSTGARYIDYVIGDPVVTPLAHAAHFSEKIAQLPLCYQPNDAQRPRPLPSSRVDWGLRDDALVLCAFHQSYKISEEVFDVWCSLLHARSDAVLWLLRWNHNVEDNLRAAAHRRGIDDSRLVFAPLLPVQQHLSRLACADIYLDAWPCNAHTTASEALWVGVPVVTLQGPTFAQRVASSLLHAVQLDELICHDADGYVRQVLALADNAPRRAALRKRLDQQSRSNALFDGATLARNLEDLLIRMWQRALRGQVAQHLPAPRRVGAAQDPAGEAGGSPVDRSQHSSEPLSP